jgi:serine/threonine protein kinase
MVKKSKSLTKSDTDSLVSDVRIAYNNFQSSWFHFAGLITKIHDESIWSTLGHGSFKEYCLVEFNDMNYSTIIKFINVMHSHIGSLLGKKVTKDPSAHLPAWETCYQLKIAESRLPKEEMPVLYKDVLDGNASLNKIKKKIREIQYVNDPDFVEIKDDDVFESDDINAVDELSDTEDVALSTSDQLAISCMSLSRKLRKGLETLNSTVEEGTRSTVDLAEVIYNDLLPVLNIYVDRMEEITKDEDEDNG